LYYSKGKEEIRIKYAKVDHGNYISWFETQVVTPRVVLPKALEENTDNYYTAAMVHCCSQDTIDAQGYCFSDSISDGLKKRCWGGAEIMCDEEISAMTENNCKPPFKQFIHWLVVNIPEKKRMNLKRSKSANKGETVISYAPLTKNMPRKGSGTHRYAFFLFKQIRRIKNEKKLMSKAEKPNKEKVNSVEANYTKVCVRQFDNLKDLYDCKCENNVHLDVECPRKLYTISAFARKFKLGNPIKANYFYSANF